MAAKTPHRGLRLPDDLNREPAAFGAGGRALHYRHAESLGCDCSQARKQQSSDMLASTSTKTLLLWTASLAVAALSGFGIGLYVSSRPEAPKVETPPNTGIAPHESDSEDDTNDLEDIAKVKAGMIEPCKMARTLHFTCARSSNHFCRSSW
jgi:hypothetical protein